MVLMRYILVAGLAYAIDLGGFMLLISIHYSPLVANVLVKIVAAVFGFYAHRYFTYSIVDKEEIGKHAIRYFGLALFYTPVSSLVLYLIMLVCSNPVYAKIITDISLFVLMFWITSKFAFARGDSKTTPAAQDLHGVPLNGPE
ncbi:putative flippase GtrA [Actimicrobium sp. GrIS 1.19]|nr:putative flippase GtrA [Actimicrobium sp. GrIS 1.19]